VRDLADGTVVMSSAYNGRILRRRPSRRASAVWSGGIYDFDFWALPVACGRKRAERFVAFASQPAQQKKSSPRTSPTARPTARRWSNWRRRWRRTAYGTAQHGQRRGHERRSLAEHGDALEQRFQDWAKR
jgi:putative spermidine/putrescine transport system substrate-binding protein